MGIHVKNICKRFEDFVALQDVSLEIASGELIALLGPSGSGKTTLLRIIAGLEFSDSGEVLLEGEEATSKQVQERKVGFMFQHYALFRHMTVFENVAFGLRVLERKRRPSASEIQARVLELLRLVHLEGLHGRYPAQLSGGQRQRVALARALAVRPRVLLLDEPFGALDAKVRKELRRFMRRLHDEIHVTTVFVTHDQEEAMEVADRVVVMSNGKIEQVGSPDEVWNHPRNSFVYDFLGNYNQFAGWRDAEGRVHLLEEESDPKGMLPYGEGHAVTLFARPHEMIVARAPDAHEFIQARIIHINPAGPLVKLEMERLNGVLLQVEISAEVIEKLSLKRGDSVLVRPKRTRVFE